jgi:hypothetical protein
MISLFTWLPRAVPRPARGIAGATAIAFRSKLKFGTGQ